MQAMINKIEKEKKELYIWQEYSASVLIKK